MNQIFTNNDFTGLMGSTEMECAVAVIVNLCNNRGVPLSRIQFTRDDFKPEGYDRDGFDELHSHDWLEHLPNGKYRICAELLDRIRRRMKKVRRLA